MPYIAQDLVAATNAIAAVRALDLRSATIEEIFNLLTLIFRGYRIKAPIFEPGITLFRSRICDKPSHITALLAPRPKLRSLDA
jgi:hypothetical protein